MSEFANKLSGKVKEQWEQIEGSANQLSKAGRGLVVKVSKEAEKTFSELVEVGEKQKTQDVSIIEQVKTSFNGQFESVSGSVEHLKLATLGLFTKLRESSEKSFKELVELGEDRELNSNSVESKKATA